MAEYCSSCGGTGDMGGYTCKVCGGLGYILPEPESEKLTSEIEAEAKSAKGAKKAK